MRLVSLRRALCVIALAVTTGEAQQRLEFRIGGLTQTMSRQLDSAFAEIQQINLRTRLLSINAQIEAARAGEAGATFGVVAGEMASLAQCTTESARRLDLDTRNSINSMIQTIQTLGSEIRGTRLSDLAMTNIDLIDRNLYERSCDVRWWARLLWSSRR